ncbi:hypothetical protein K443DRAFT_672975 [Laccaria amethystina LaAM-08-1]|uniref:tRNA-splicing endonuclease subunit Sen54 N-terminal domain-containing protein n=1 Tax=Laccaria amethystina LaAM-08-1 TaxID=1095629 RepID=A0A0C9YCM2_9AGAR|nr:hypothetical protein K443DRAFT_672975 [Laccaria amethystina LaAM-08-1]
MDDTLELPNAIAPKISLGDAVQEEDEQSSDGEDGGLDWTKLIPGAVRPVIPKRGEKEFEPKAGGGSNLQLHVLDRARSAMLEALRAIRTTSSKAISYAVWQPSVARTHVTVARGIHFSSMGHSAPRSMLGENGVEKIQKRLELLPEEAIYLIERGSMFCWKETDLNLSEVSGAIDVLGAPMSVQQAYSEMIGTEDLTLDKFQVFSYLKRLGYVVTRTKPPTSYYPTPPNTVIVNTAPSILQRISSLFPTWASWLTRLCGGFDWWRPMRVSRWLHHDKNYASLFRSLRFIPSGHRVPLRQSKSVEVESPYQIFYNLYKPSTPFKKTAPPPPDFQIVVINARTTPMPTLQELTDLFDVLPELPTPLPRQRRPIPGIANPAIPSPAINENAATTQTLNAANQLPPSLFHRLLPWLFPRPAVPQPLIPVRRPNPFMALKAGKKMIVIAVVDSGSVGFFRFSQGAFTEWPMM